MPTEAIPRSPSPAAAAPHEHYDAATIWLYWSTVAFVAILWVLGQLTGWLPRGSFRSFSRSTHVTLGLLFAVALAMRILWRAKFGSAPPATDTGALNWLAKGTHYGLCLLLVGVVGLGIANASYRGDSLYDVVDMPRFGSGDPATEHAIGSWHEWAANLTVLLAVFHAVAALGHRYVWRDHLLDRMRPRRKTGNEGRQTGQSPGRQRGLAG